MEKRQGIVFIGMETSGTLRRAFQAQGYETYSADLLPSEDGGEDMAFSDDGLPLGRHLGGDVFLTLDNLRAADLWPRLAWFHPTCTYHTNSAAWALHDPDFKRYPGVGYHQRVKPGTLVGAARREARFLARQHVHKLARLDDLVGVENPIGTLGDILGQPQVVQPYMFGDDASKATCIWRKGIPPLEAPPEDEWAKPRMVDGRPRWANQTDSGQNRLSPGEDRWRDRARTYPGIAAAIVGASVKALERQG